MERLLVLADDFTGACDAAGAFGNSCSTVVVTAAPPEWPAGVDVLAVDLDVRERSAASARTATESVARCLGRHGRVFLKIDSTLRGPIAALVEGALEGSKRATAMVAPAFPEQGRLVVEGRLIVNGEPGVRVRDVLGQARHVVLDAADAAALREVVREAERHPERLLVGSAGLCRQLAPAGPTVRPDVPNDGPVLVVAGSPAKVTREQLQSLEGVPDVVVLATPPTDTRDAGQAAAALAWRAASERPRAVVLTGGATARAVIHRVEARQLRILGELQPGIPLGRLEDGAWHGMIVVTKAGGFGTPSTLLDVVRALGPSSSP